MRKGDREGREVLTGRALSRAIILGVRCHWGHLADGTDHASELFPWECEEDEVCICPHWLLAEAAPQVLTPRQARRQSCKCLSPPRCLRHEVGWGRIEAVGRALTASATNNKEASVTEEPTYTRIKV